MPGPWERWDASAGLLTSRGAWADHQPRSLRLSDACASPRQPFGIVVHHRCAGEIRPQLNAGQLAKRSKAARWLDGLKSVSHKFCRSYTRRYGRVKEVG